MTSVHTWFNALLPAKTKATLSSSRAYRITRYVAAGLLIFIAILALVAAWYTQRYAAGASAESAPVVTTVGDTTTTVTTVVNAGTQNHLRTYSYALFEATLAFGILGLILGVAVLGVRKQPASLVTLSLGIIFIIILTVLIALCFDDGFTVSRIITTVTESKVTTTTVDNVVKTTTTVTVTTTTVDGFTGTSVVVLGPTTF